MKKDQRIEVRLTAEEKKEIVKKAESVGMNLSQFARQTLINGTVINLSDEEKRNITGIGRNFNQLVKFSHVSNRIPNDLQEEIQSIINHLKKYYY